MAAPQSGQGNCLPNNDWSVELKSPNVTLTLARSALVMVGLLSVPPIKKQEELAQGLDFASF
jgi:hypothetical protein